MSYGRFIGELDADPTRVLTRGEVVENTLNVLTYADAQALTSDDIAVYERVQTTGNATEPPIVLNVIRDSSGYALEFVA